MTDKVENIPVLRTSSNTPIGRGTIEGNKLIIEFADAQFAEDLLRLAEYGTLSAFTLGNQFRGGVGAFARMETS